MKHFQSTMKDSLIVLTRSPIDRSIARSTRTYFSLSIDHQRIEQSRHTHTQSFICLSIFSRWMSFISFFAIAAFLSIQRRCFWKAMSLFNISVKIKFYLFNVQRKVKWFKWFDRCMDEHQHGFVMKSSMENSLKSPVQISNNRKCKRNFSKCASLVFLFIDPFVLVVTVNPPVKS